MVNKWLFIFLVLGLIGCKSKHSITSSNISTSDSVVTVYRVDTIIETTRQTDTIFIRVKDPVANNVLIKEPCDSIRGLLRDFIVKAGNTTITAEDGSLYVTTKCDSVIESYKESEMEKESLLIKIKQLESQISQYESANKVEEKTGIVGWLEKWRIGISWFIAGIIASTIFWFIMRLLGKV